MPPAKPHLLVNCSSIDSCIPILPIAAHDIPDTVIYSAAFVAASRDPYCYPAIIHPTEATGASVTESCRSAGISIGIACSCHDVAAYADISCCWSRRCRRLWSLEAFFASNRHQSLCLPRRPHHLRLGDLEVARDTSLRSAFSIKMMRFEKRC